MANEIFSLYGSNSPLTASADSVTELDLSEELSSESELKNELAEAKKPGIDFSKLHVAPTLTGSGLDVVSGKTRVSSDVFFKNLGRGLGVVPNNSEIDLSSNTALLALSNVNAVKNFAHDVALGKYAPIQKGYAIDAESFIRQDTDNVFRDMLKAKYKSVSDKNPLFSDNVFDFDLYHGSKKFDPTGKHRDDIIIGFKKLEDDQIRKGFDQLFSGMDEQAKESLNILANPNLSTKYKSFMLSSLMDRNPTFHITTDIATLIKDLKQESSATAKQYFGENADTVLNNIEEYFTKVKPVEKMLTTDLLNDQTRATKRAKITEEDAAWEHVYKPFVGTLLRDLEGVADFVFKNSLSAEDAGKAGLDNTSTFTKFVRDSVGELRDWVGYENNNYLVEFKDVAKSKDAGDITVSSKFLDKLDNKEFAKAADYLVKGLFSYLGEGLESYALASLPFGVGVGLQAVATADHIMNDIITNNGYTLPSSTDVLQALSGGVISAVGSRLVQKALYSPNAVASSVTQEQVKQFTTKGLAVSLGIKAVIYEGVSEFFEEGQEEFWSQLNTKAFKDGFDYGRMLANGLMGATQGGMSGGMIKAGQVGLAGLSGGVENAVRTEYSIDDRIEFNNSSSYQFKVMEGINDAIKASVDLNTASALEGKDSRIIDPDSVSSYLDTKIGKLEEDMKKIEDLLNTDINFMDKYSANSSKQAVSKELGLIKDVKLNFARFSDNGETVKSELLAEVLASNFSNDSIRKVLKGVETFSNLKSKLSYQAPELFFFDKAVASNTINEAKTLAVKVDSIYDQLTDSGKVLSLSSMSDTDLDDLIKLQEKSKDLFTDKTLEKSKALLTARGVNTSYISNFVEDINSLTNLASTIKSGREINGYLAKVASPSAVPISIANLVTTLLGVSPASVTTLTDIAFAEYKKSEASAESLTKDEFLRELSSATVTVKLNPLTGVNQLTFNENNVLTSNKALLPTFKAIVNKLGDDVLANPSNTDAKAKYLLFSSLVKDEVDKKVSEGKLVAVTLAQTDIKNKVVAEAKGKLETVTDPAAKTQLTEFIADSNNLTKLQGIQNNPLLKDVITVVDATTAPHVFTTANSGNVDTLVQQLAPVDTQLNHKVDQLSSSSADQFSNLLFHKTVSDEDIKADLALADRMFLNAQDVKANTPAYKDLRNVEAKLKRAKDLIKFFELQKSPTNEAFISNMVVNIKQTALADATDAFNDNFKAVDKVVKFDEDMRKRVGDIAVKKQAFRAFSRELAKQKDQLALKKADYSSVLDPNRTKARTDEATVKTVISAFDTKLAEIKGILGSSKSATPLKLSEHAQIAKILDVHEAVTNTKDSIAREKLKTESLSLADIKQVVVDLNAYFVKAQNKAVGLYHKGVELQNSQLKGTAQSGLKISKVDDLKAIKYSEMASKEFNAVVDEFLQVMHEPAVNSKNTTAVYQSLASLSENALKTLNTQYTVNVSSLQDLAKGASLKDTKLDPKTTGFISFLVSKGKAVTEADLTSNLDAYKKLKTDAFDYVIKGNDVTTLPMLAEAPLLHHYKGLGNSILSSVGRELEETKDTQAKITASLAKLSGDLFIPATNAPKLSKYLGYRYIDQLAVSDIDFTIRKLYDGEVDRNIDKNVIKNLGNPLLTPVSKVQVASVISKFKFDASRAFIDKLFQNTNRAIPVESIDITDLDREVASETIKSLLKASVAGVSLATSYSKSNDTAVATETAKLAAVDTALKNFLQSANLKDGNTLGNDSLSEANLEQAFNNDALTAPLLGALHDAFNAETIKLTSSQLTVTSGANQIRIPYAFIPQKFIKDLHGVGVTPVIKSADFKEVISVKAMFMANETAFLPEFTNLISGSYIQAPARNALAMPASVAKERYDSLIKLLSIDPSSEKFNRIEFTPLKSLLTTVQSDLKQLSSAVSVTGVSDIAKREAFNNFFKSSSVSSAFKSLLSSAGSFDGKPIQNILTHSSVSADTFVNSSSSSVRRFTQDIVNTVNRKMTSENLFTLRATTGEVSPLFTKLLTSNKFTSIDDIQTIIRDDVLAGNQLLMDRLLKAFPMKELFDAYQGFTTKLEEYYTSSNKNKHLLGLLSDSLAEVNPKAQLHSGIANAAFFSFLQIVTARAGVISIPNLDPTEEAHKIESAILGRLITGSGLFNLSDNTSADFVQTLLKNIGLAVDTITSSKVTNVNEVVANLFTNEKESFKTLAKASGLVVETTNEEMNVLSKPFKDQIKLVNKLRADLGIENMPEDNTKAIPNRFYFKSVKTGASITENIHMAETLNTANLGEDSVSFLSGVGRMLANNGSGLLLLNPFLNGSDVVIGSPQAPKMNIKGIEIDLSAHPHNRVHLEELSKQAVKLTEEYAIVGEYLDMLSRNYSEPEIIDAFSQIDVNGRIDIERGRRLFDHASRAVSSLYANGKGANISAKDFKERMSNIVVSGALAVNADLYNGMIKHLRQWQEMKHYLLPTYKQSHRAPLSVDELTSAGFKGFDDFSALFSTGFDIDSVGTKFVGDPAKLTVLQREVKAMLRSETMPDSSELAQLFSSITNLSVPEVKLIQSYFSGAPIPTATFFKDSAYSKFYGQFKRYIDSAFRNIRSGGVDSLLNTGVTPETVILSDELLSNFSKIDWYVERNQSVNGRFQVANPSLSWINDKAWLRSFTVNKDTDDLYMFNPETRQFNGQDTDFYGEFNDKWLETLTTGIEYKGHQIRPENGFLFFTTQAKMIQALFGKMALNSALRVYNSQLSTEKKLYDDTNRFDDEITKLIFRVSNKNGSSSILDSEFLSDTLKKNIKGWRTANTANPSAIGAKLSTFLGLVPSHHSMFVSELKTSVDWLSANDIDLDVNKSATEKHIKILVKFVEQTLISFNGEHKGQGRRFLADFLANTGTAEYVDSLGKTSAEKIAFAKRFALGGLEPAELTAMLDYFDVSLPTVANAEYFGKASILTRPFLSKIMHEIDGLGNGPALTAFQSLPSAYFEAFTETAADGSQELKKVTAQSTYSTLFAGYLNNTDIDSHGYINDILLAAAGVTGVWGDLTNTAPASVSDKGGDTVLRMNQNLFMLMRDLTMQTKLTNPTDLHHERFLKMSNEVLSTNVLFKSIKEFLPDIDFSGKGNKRHNFDVLRDIIDDAIVQKRVRLNEIYFSAEDMKSLFHSIVTRFNTGTTGATTGFKLSKHGVTAILNQTADDRNVYLSKFERLFLNATSLKTSSGKQGLEVSSRARDIYETIGIAVSALAVKEGKLPSFLEATTAKELTRKLLKFPIMTKEYNASDLATLQLHGNDVLDQQVHPRLNAFNKVLDAKGSVDLTGSEDFVFVRTLVEGYADHIDTYLGSKTANLDHTKIDVLIKYGLTTKELLKTNADALRKAVKDIVSNGYTQKTEKDLSELLVSDGLFSMVIGSIGGAPITSSINTISSVKTMQSETLTAVATLTAGITQRQEALAIEFSNALDALQSEFVGDKNNKLKEVHNLLNSAGVNITRHSDFASGISKYLKSMGVADFDITRILGDIDKDTVGSINKAVQLGKSITYKTANNLVVKFISNSQSLGTTVMMVHSSDGNIMGSIAVQSQFKGSEYHIYDIFDAVLLNTVDVPKVFSAMNRSVITFLLSPVKSVYSYILASPAIGTTAVEFATLKNMVINWVNTNNRKDTALLAGAQAVTSRQELDTFITTNLSALEGLDNKSSIQASFRAMSENTPRDMVTLFLNKFITKDTVITFYGNTFDTVNTILKNITTQTKVELGLQELYKAVSTITNNNVRNELLTKFSLSKYVKIDKDSSNSDYALITHYAETYAKEAKKGVVTSDDMRKALTGKIVTYNEIVKADKDYTFSVGFDQSDLSNRHSLKLSNSFAYTDPAANPIFGTELNSTHSKISFKDNSLAGHRIRLVDDSAKAFTSFKTDFSSMIKEIVDGNKSLLSGVYTFLDLAGIRLDPATDVLPTRNQLLGKLARYLHELNLSPKVIKRLKDNYNAVVLKNLGLPANTFSGTDHERVYFSEDDYQRLLVTLFTEVSYRGTVLRDLLDIVVNDEQFNTSIIGRRNKDANAYIVNIIEPVFKNLDGPIMEVDESLVDVLKDARKTTTNWEQQYLAKGSEGKWFVNNKAYRDSLRDKYVSSVTATDRAKVRLALIPEQNAQFKHFLENKNEYHIAKVHVDDSLKAAPKFIKTYTAVDRTAGWNTRINQYQTNYSTFKKSSGVFTGNKSLRENILELFESDGIVPASARPVVNTNAVNTPPNNNLTVKELLTSSYNEKDPMTEVIDLTGTKGLGEVLYAKYLHMVSGDSKSFLSTTEKLDDVKSTLQHFDKRMPVDMSNVKVVFKYSLDAHSLKHIQVHTTTFDKVIVLSNVPLALRINSKTHVPHDIHKFDDHLDKDSTKYKFNKQLLLQAISGEYGVGAKLAGALDQVADTLTAGVLNRAQAQHEQDFLLPTINNKLKKLADFSDSLGSGIYNKVLNHKLDLENPPKPISLDPAAHVTAITYSSHTANHMLGEEVEQAPEFRTNLNNIPHTQEDKDRPSSAIPMSGASPLVTLFKLHSTLSQNEVSAAHARHVDLFDILLFAGLEREAFKGKLAFYMNVQGIGTSDALLDMLRDHFKYLLDFLHAANKYVDSLTGMDVEANLNSLSSAEKKAYEMFRANLVSAKLLKELSMIDGFMAGRFDFGLMHNVIPFLGKPLNQVYSRNTPTDLIYGNEDTTKLNDYLENYAQVGNVKKRIQALNSGYGDNDQTFFEHALVPVKVPNLTYQQAVEKHLALHPKVRGEVDTDPHKADLVFNYQIFRNFEGGHKPNSIVPAIPNLDSTPYAMVTDSDQVILVKHPSFNVADEFGGLGEGKLAFEALLESIQEEFVHLATNSLHTNAITDKQLRKSMIQKVHYVEHFVNYLKNASTLNPGLYKNHETVINSILSDDSYLGENSSFRHIFKQGIINTASLLSEFDALMFNMLNQTDKGVSDQFKELVEAVDDAYMASVKRDYEAATSKGKSNVKKTTATPIALKRKYGLLGVNTSALNTTANSKDFLLEPLISKDFIVAGYPKPSSFSSFDPSILYNNPDGSPSEIVTRGSFKDSDENVTLSNAQHKKLYEKLDAFSKLYYIAKLQQDLRKSSDYAGITPHRLSIFGVTMQKAGQPNEQKLSSGFDFMDSAIEEDIEKTQGYTFDKFKADTFKDDYSVFLGDSPLSRSLSRLDNRKGLQEPSHVLDAFTASGATPVISDIATDLRNSELFENVVGANSVASQQKMSNILYSGIFNTQLINETSNKTASAVYYFINSFFKHNSDSAAKALLELVSMGDIASFIRNRNTSYYKLFTPTQHSELLDLSRSLRGHGTTLAKFGSLEQFIRAHKLEDKRLEVTALFAQITFKDSAISPMQADVIAKLSTRSNVSTELLDQLGLLSIDNLMPTFKVNNEVRVNDALNFKSLLGSDEVMLVPTSDLAKFDKTWHKVKVFNKELALMKRWDLTLGHVEGLYKNVTKQVNLFSNTELDESGKDQLLKKHPSLAKYLLPSKMDNAGKSTHWKYHVSNQTMVDSLLTGKVNYVEMAGKIIGKTHESFLLANSFKDTNDRILNELVSSRFTKEGFFVRTDKALEDEFKDTYIEIKGDDISDTYFRSLLFKDPDYKVFVRKAIKAQLIGYKEFGLASIFENDVPRTILKLESLFKGFVSLGMHNVVVSVPNILVNIIGSIAMSMAGGKGNPISYFKYYYESFDKLATVKTLMKESVQEFVRGLGSYKGDIASVKDEIVAILNRRLAKAAHVNDIREFLDPQLMQSMLNDSIIEQIGGKNAFRDVVIDHLLGSVLDKSIIGTKLLALPTTLVSSLLTLGKDNDRLRGKLLGPATTAQNVLSEVFMLPESITGKALGSIIQGSDFMGRYAIYKSNREYYIKQGLSAERANQVGLQKANDYMIDYAKTLPPATRIAGQYGFIPFVTFFVRVQRAFTKVIYDSYVGDDGYKQLTSKEWYKAVAKNTEYMQILRLLGSHTGVEHILENFTDLKAESYNGLNAFLPYKLATGTSIEDLVNTSFDKLTNPAKFVDVASPGFYKELVEQLGGSEVDPAKFLFRK